MSVWTPGYIFYTLGDSLSIHYLFGCMRTHTSLLSCAGSSSRLILQSLPQAWNQPFSKHLWFLLLDNGVRNQNLAGGGLIVIGVLLLLDKAPEQKIQNNLLRESSSGSSLLTTP